MYKTCILIHSTTKNRVWEADPMLVVTVLKEAFPEIFSLKLVTLDKTLRSTVLCICYSLDCSNSHFYSKQVTACSICRELSCSLVSLPYSSPSQQLGKRIPGQSRNQCKMWFFFFSFLNQQLLKPYISNSKKKTKQKTLTFYDLIHSELLDLKVNAC